jgi:hypothetical protein
MKVSITYLSIALVGILALTWWFTEQGDSDSESAERISNEARSAQRLHGTEHSERDRRSTSSSNRSDKSANEKLAQWLRDNDGDPRAYAQALFAVSMIKGDSDMLRKAIAADPNNPQLLLHGSCQSDFSDAERMELSKRLLTKDPNNTMAAYVYAHELARSGDMQGSIDMMRNSQQLSEFKLYREQTVEALENAYKAAGYPPLIAKILGTQDLSTRPISSIHQLFTKHYDPHLETLPPEDALELRSLSASVEHNMRHVNKSPTVIDELMGIDIASNSLKGLDDNAPSHFQGMTVAEAKAELLREKEEIATLTFTVSQEILPAPTEGPSPEALTRWAAQLDSELIEQFIDYTMQDGEVKALLWYAEQTGLTIEPPEDAEQ